MKIKYDMEMMKIIAMFERLTHVSAKDCFEHNEAIYFLVPEGEVRKAVGKSAQNAKKLSAMLQKKIKIIGYSEDLCQFVRNMIKPLQVRDVTVEGKIVTITDDDPRTKGLIIGRNAANLRALEQHVRRHFDIEEIKVV